MQQGPSHVEPSAARPPSDGSGHREIAFEVFDTRVRLAIHADDGVDADDAWAARADAALLEARDRCAFFERALSRMLPDSDISRALAAAPAPVPVEPETAELVEAAHAYCEASGGRFDITMGSVTRLWDFRRGAVPARLALSRALAHVDHRAVSAWTGADGASMLVLEDPQAALDLGGIAKGYVADDLAARIEAAGFDRYALNLGGNVLVHGGRATGEPWRIGIVDPWAPDRCIATVAVVDGSVVTSGAHERRFARGGRVYHHILDPSTGMPAETDLACATVVSPRSIDGDGYSTTLFMMGSREAPAFVEGVAGIEAVFVDVRGGVRWTSGLSGLVEVA
ncbi:MAG: FAD:protein FMN transferase [Collinsella phocaeensis]